MQIKNKKIRVKTNKHACTFDELNEKPIEGDLCYIDAIMSAFGSHYKCKNNRQLTHDDVLNILGITKEKAQRNGLSYNDIKPFFDEFKCYGLIVYNFQFKKLMTYNELCSRLLKVVMKNDHIYALDPITKRDETQDENDTVKLSSNFNIKEREADTCTIFIQLMKFVRFLTVYITIRREN